jgi:hypothetical protein
MRNPDRDSASRQVGVEPDDRRLLEKRHAL